ncbi:MAG: DUF2948 family protein [Bdellovibrionales bacterium]
MMKLKAKDSEDVEVISAILQDAIAPVVDMIYRPEEKDFIMIVQRFCRDEGRDCHERVRSAVHIKGVTGVRLHGIDKNRRDDMLDLLAVMPVDKNALQFVFAGGGRIRLDLDDWLLVLEDFGEPWPTGRCPEHPGENASA